MNPAPGILKAEAFLLKSGDFFLHPATMLGVDGLPDLKGHFVQTQGFDHDIRLFPIKDLVDLTPLGHHEDYPDSGKALAAVFQKAVILRQSNVRNDHIEDEALQKAQGLLHIPGQVEFPEIPEFDDLGQKLQTPVILIDHQDAAPAGGVLLMSGEHPHTSCPHPEIFLNLT
jgi:hypothetical protein